MPPIWTDLGLGPGPLHEIKVQGAATKHASLEAEKLSTHAKAFTLTADFSTGSANKATSHVSSATPQGQGQSDGSVSPNVIADRQSACNAHIKATYDHLKAISVHKEAGLMHMDASKLHWLMGKAYNALLQEDNSNHLSDAFIAAFSHSASSESAAHFNAIFAHVNAADAHMEFVGGHKLAMDYHLGMANTHVKRLSHSHLDS